MVPKWIFKILHYFTIRVFCQRARKEDEIPYVRAFMSLHHKDAAQENCNLIAQRLKERSKRCRDDVNEKQREEEREEYTANLALLPLLPELLPTPSSLLVATLIQQSYGMGQGNPGIISPFKT